jgi:type IV pilus assembly protein PilA
MKKSNQKGFTLLEILLVVAAIAILAGIVIIAINPSKQLADVRNAQRSSNVNTILNAVYQYAVDNKGLLPSGASPSSTISTTPKSICNTLTTSTSTCATSNMIDLSALTNNQVYLTAIPTDPSSTTALDVGYGIYKSANGRVTVIASSTENGIPTISVTR